MSKVARYDQGSILAPMFSLMVCIGLLCRRQKGREGRGECAFLPLPSPAPSPFCAPMFSSEYVLDCVAGVRRGGEGEGERKRKRERGMRFSPPPLPRSLPFLCPHVFIRVCIRLRDKRQKGRGGRGRGGGEKRERGMRFSPPPLPFPAPSPFCAPMLSSEYVLDCVAGVRRRGRGGEEEKKGEGNALFSPSPSPALSPLCACHED